MTDWPPEPLAPQQPHYETVWRLRGPSQRSVVCTIEGDAVGLEVRITRENPEDIIDTRRASSLTHAHAVADELRATLLADGAFTEVRECH
jgi:hypothetical protein